MTIVYGILCKEYGVTQVKVVRQLRAAMQADCVVLGGRQCKLLKKLPPVRAWETMQTHSPSAMCAGAQTTILYCLSLS